MARRAIISKERIGNNIPHRKWAETLSEEYVSIHLLSIGVELKVYNLTNCRT